MTTLNFLPDRFMQFLAVSLLAAGPLHIANAAGDVQSARSTSGFASDRGVNERHDSSTLRQFEGQARQVDTGASKQAITAANHLDCCGYRIFSTRTQLFDDIDRDGFYTYLRVSLDIDTDYDRSELYLQVYLRGAVGPWSLVYDGDVFTIHGNSALDAYEVESELLAGYPTDYYDVLVEVYDAYTGELVLDHGPAESESLSLLPMEEVLLDARTLPPIALSHGGGGGSLSAMSLLVLLLLASWRLNRRRIGLSCITQTSGKSTR